MKKNNFLSRLAYNCSFAGLISISSFIKFSWIVGSHISFFSGINVFAPLSGAFGGLFGSVVSLVIRSLVHLCIFGVLSIKFLTIGIPTFCASLYWSTTHFFVRAGLPFVCMLLFWVHPIGAVASSYALFWIIPIIIHYAAYKNIFLQALGSTFVAHAVGSVIWLYAKPMAASAWLALIPVVAVERLLFATGMVVVHYVISMIIDFVHTKQIDTVIKKNTITHTL